MNIAGAFSSLSVNPLPSADSVTATPQTPDPVKTITPSPAPVSVKASPSSSALQKPKSSLSSMPMPDCGSIFGNASVKNEESSATKNNSKRNFKYDEASLQQAWLSYADSIEGKLVLTQTIKNASTLSIGEDNEIIVSVSNTYQQQELQNEGSEILSFLCNELRNDNLKLKVIVDERLSQDELSQTDSDLFAEQRTENQILEFLAKDLELEI